MGPIPAVGLGSLRIINQEPPEVWEHLLGNPVLGFVLASPYSLALAQTQANMAVDVGSTLALV